MGEKSFMGEYINTMGMHDQMHMPNVLAFCWRLFLELTKPCAK